MDGRPKLTDEPTWKKLQEYYNNNGSKLNIYQLMKENPSRFDKFSLILPTPEDGDILLDYSKNRINDEVFSLLLDLAKARKIEAARDSMFTAQKINFTEDRAVLHVALRNRSNTPIVLEGKDVMPDVNAVLDHMKEFTNEVLSKN